MLWPGRTGAPRSAAHLGSHRQACTGSPRSMAATAVNTRPLLGSDAGRVAAVNRERQILRHQAVVALHTREGPGSIHPLQEVP